MSGLSSTMYAAVGAISAALISAAIAYLSLIISKEQSISAFRQAWIDALREDLADFVGAATSLTLVAYALKEKKFSSTVTAYDEILPKLEKPVGEAYVKYSRIKLRLNPEEHKTLIEKLNALENAFSHPEILTDTVKTGKMVLEFIAESQVVLKCEWNRVKQGEPTYRVTKIVSASMAGFLTLVFGYAIFLVL